ncbi:MAG: PEP/pyruvate-binding domain-containing protein, partial [Clostridiales Family XIII bacterium]|nr:PEP/pyruvate-binding domain-containing protein [Clostridiales Family XIII bacterium]
MINQKRAFSGYDGLDEALDFMRFGDIVVWQVSSIDEYRFFAMPFVGRAQKERKNIVYFRFGAHAPLVTQTDGIKVYDIAVKSGFESMVMTISDIIEEEGRETYYIFDSMTDLQEEWIADFMMGNFFVVTAPEVAKTNSVAYFSVQRNHHSVECMSRIRETASVLIDVFKGENETFIQPIKVQDRYLPTIFLPHRIDANDPASIKPLTNGIELARYYSLVGQSGNMDSTQNLDNWERFFLAKKGEAQHGGGTEGLRDLCRMVFGADEHILDIAMKNVTLTDLLDIKARMIGVGGIGGKATGMILSRKIIEKRLPEVAKILEPHDSFYICSNLYYTFLVRNRSWGLKIKQRKRRGYFTVAEIIKEKILEGRFSDPIREQFRRMLEYFGQSPIIVRSSSLLEDGFGNAFAGKYESVFCVNKGTLEERLLAFEDAVRTVYASTMDESVLEY